MDEKELVERYAERFFEDGTEVKKIICVDFLPDGLSANDLYDELTVDEDDFPALFGPWWKSDGGEDAEFAAAMILGEKGGWIIQAETALPSDVIFREDGRPWRWRICGLHAEITVYAPTLSHALERVAVEGRRRVKQEFAKARALRGLPTPEGE